MEATEAQELQEHAEHGAGESRMRPVAFTMSVLAVLVAVTTVLGHRTHTEAVLDQTRAAVEQNRATDAWNFYQAKKIRSSDTELMQDLMAVVAVADKPGAKKKIQSYADHKNKWADDLKSEEQGAREEEDKVRNYERKVDQAEARADRFDLAEALLEIGLVITSVTLLTRSYIYWYMGLVFSVLGVALVGSAFLIH